MSKGVLLFARNNAQIDYCKQAYWLAKRVNEYLNLPTTIVTDSTPYLLHEFPDAEHVFDKIISIVWKNEDLKENTTLSKTEKHGLRTFNDGTLVEKKLEFKNETRTLAYNLSPYDETLILDTDVVICNDIFKECFDNANDFLIYRTAYDLAQIDHSNAFERISDTSVDFYWATCVYFKKTPTNKIFFDLLQHIQENWIHYNNIFQIKSPYYRNDYSFSIAIHIMNGYQRGDFAKPMPGTLYYTTDKSILWKIDSTSLLLLLQKETYKGEYVPLRIKDANVHIMNKFSLNRCIDEQ
tara:strand:- start:11570 stop:12454 length:885 start_codon:yes stop_codon:yes gene_type:complete